MTTMAGGPALADEIREAHRSEAKITENVRTLMARSGGMKTYQLAAALGISAQTMGRRLKDEQPWNFWEVEALARFFRVSLDEISGGLPDRELWLVRHQGLEPRTRWLAVTLKSGPISGPKAQRHLRVVA